MKNTRILLVSPEFPPKVGGIGRLAVRMASGFANCGLDVLALGPLCSDDLNVAPMIKHDSESYPFPLLGVGPMRRPGVKVPRTPQAQLTRSFLETSISELDGFFRPDLVLSMTVGITGFIGTCIANSFNVPHIGSVRGIDVGAGIFRSDHLPFTNHVMEKSAAVTFVNEYLLRIGSMVYGKMPHFKVIHNGIDESPPSLLSNREKLRRELRERLGIQPDDFVVGYTGTFRDKKGIRYLNDAFVALNKEAANSKLLIVGGPRDEQERRMAPDLFNGGPTAWPVFNTGLLVDRESVLSYYHAMDCALVPSIEDGLPNAMLEAMSLGLPVVGTDIFDDVIEDRKDGLLVPRYDARALVDACLELRGDEELRKRLGENAALSVVERFSAEREREAYLALFKELLQEDKG